MTNIIKTTLVLIITSSLLDAQPAISSLEDPGLMAIENRNIMIRTGTHHLIINTNTNINDDLEELLQLKSDLDQTCENTQSSCDLITPEIKRLIWSARKQIYSKNRPKRSKGAIEKIYDFLFGSNEPDPQTISFRSAGATVSALSTFRTIENELQERQKITQQNMEKLRQLNDENINILSNETNKIERGIQLIMLENSIDKHVRIILKKYEEKTYIDLIKMEIPKIEQDITKLYPNHKLPDLSQEQLLKLVTVDMKRENNTVTAIASFPLISQKQFKEYYVFPTPDLTTRKVPSFNPQNVIIQAEDELYVEEPDLISINISTAITARPIIIKKKITNCILRTLIDHKMNCPMEDLPTKFDWWFETPIPNFIGFISNAEKLLRCPTSVKKIKPSSGVIQLQPGCTISTDNVTIAASPDKTSKEFKLFHFNKQDMTVKIGNIDQKITAPELNTLPKVADGTIEDTINTLNNLTAEDTIWTGTNITLLVTLSIVIIIALWLAKRLIEKTTPPLPPSPQIPLHAIPPNHTTTNQDTIIKTIPLTNVDISKQ